MKRGVKGSHHADEPMSATGTLIEFHWNHHDALDGFRLDDETEVKFPPHLAQELEACVHVGEPVFVHGRRHVTPKGDIHLHADQIVNQTTKASVNRHEPPAHAEELSPPSHADIMRELKELRSLVERMAQPRTKSKPAGSK